MKRYRSIYESASFGASNEYVTTYNGDQIKIFFDAYPTEDDYGNSRLEIDPEKIVLLDRDGKEVGEYEPTIPEEDWNEIALKIEEEIERGVL